MSGYTKLFSDLILSTVWREPDHVRILWITMLALRDRWHVVNASLPGLADAARISMEDCQDALERLSAPDPYSRTKDFEGRRIEPCDGGWRILNGEKYRNKMSLDERREYQRIKQREYRARGKHKDALKSCLQSSQQSTQAEKETDPESNYSPIGEGENKVSTRTPIQQIIDLYHEMLCPPLSKVVKRTSARDAHIRSRWREHEGMENFQRFFSHVKNSDFLMGRTEARNGRRPFLADLDWLMKPDNFAKVVEGKYAD